MLNLAQNALTGKLPAVWGSATAWPALQSLNLSSCQLRGLLVKQWGIQNGWVQLSTLHLDRNQLSGSLPSEWSSDSAFPALQARLRALCLRAAESAGYARLDMRSPSAPAPTLHVASVSALSQRRLCADLDAGQQPAQRVPAHRLGLHRGLERARDPGPVQQLAEWHPAPDLGQRG